MFFSHPIKYPTFSIDLRKLNPLVVVLSKRHPMLEVSDLVQFLIVRGIRWKVKFRLSQFIWTKLDDYVSVSVQLTD